MVPGFGPRAVRLARARVRAGVDSRSQAVLAAVRARSRLRPPSQCALVLSRTPAAAGGGPVARTAGPGSMSRTRWHRDRD
jgi:hypothetical protein